jgi:Leucine-rich repeat (LRR) protein/GTPase SAR1 family protein
MTEKEVLEIIEKAARDGWTDLDLSEKWIRSLPAEIGKLTNLTGLNLYRNQLTSVPAELWRLTNLTVLDLGGNQLTSIPAELGKLTNLTNLYMSENQLTSVPAELGKLANLTELYLHENQLTSIPAELWKLTKLKELSLYDNQLTSVPAELGKLTNLTDLDLGVNILTSVPVGLGKLTNLTRLDLGVNQLTNVPAELGKLTNLREFGLYDNQLTSVPAELGKLTNLVLLYLYGNRLTSVPAELSKLTNLTAFDLSGNKLTNLPAELGKLTKLETLELSGNPLESPLPEVLWHGSKALLAYLWELAKGKKERYEAKLLLLGDGGEGKTCVSRALRKLRFKKQVRTEGVEVVQWKFENPKFVGEKEKEITLNIWDFEGQEINHQSHQFFLTEKSLYLLVINGRRKFRMERAEYWLDTIRARAPESRVILVASECEKTTPSWPLDKLKANYGDLLVGENWYFAVGCEDGKGIDNLATEIKSAAADMKVMGMDWPESYQKAEERIRKRAKTDAKISRVELYKIFRERGVSEDGFENAASQMATLGIITQFQDSPELEDFVVLNPQWLTKAISLVMEDKQLEEDRGEITHERMSGIWEKDYRGLYPVFHNCMKEFELCYDMEDAAGCLVPLRFGSEVPEIPWSNICQAKERRVEYKLGIQPPMGIMSRFIVKTHYMIAKTEDMPKGVYWHNGVFLRTGEGEYRSEALCEFDHDEKTLRIQVRAAFPQNMIEQLHGFAKAVFEFFEGLKPERNYGCMKFEEVEEKECEGAHPERRILFALSRNNDIDCAKGWHVVDPKLLVFGFSSFGEEAVTVEELREELAKRPEWAEELIVDVRSSVAGIDKTYDEVVRIRLRQEELPAEFGQQVELKLRNYLGLLNEMLDNRDFNSAPAVVSIVPVDGSGFNPKNWFSKEHVLTPYCEYESGVHKVDFSVKFKKPREWWEKTAPWLAFGVKVLSAGIKIACAGLPLAVDEKSFKAMKNEVGFMKELAGHLELEGGADSDISEERYKAVFAHKGITRLRDLRMLEERDTKQIVRIQLAKLFEEIAPKNYKARQWGELRRVRMADNTYRWLCAAHAEEYKR